MEVYLTFGSTVDAAVGVLVVEKIVAVVLIYG